MFRTSPRMLEWATPFVYGVAVFSRLTLLFGTGAGRRGTKSWIAIGDCAWPAGRARQTGGHPDAVRWLAGCASPRLCGICSTCVIAGSVLPRGPAADLGARSSSSPSCSRCSSGRDEASLLLLLASPAIGLVLAFSTVPWGIWLAVLGGLLLWWRPYLWEGLAVVAANVAMGVFALPFWNRLAPYQQNVSSPF